MNHHHQIQIMGVEDENLMHVHHHHVTIYNKIYTSNLAIDILRL
jgi:hypothetical protein